MEIYVVQPNDTIDQIAEHYGVSTSSIILTNELTNPYDLVTGQTIVIVYPQQTYTVKEGDSLESIALSFGTTVMQLLRNNPSLSDRINLHPGETLIISYKTDENILINGFTYPFISEDTLIKTLPFLTYISIFNYTITKEGDIITYYDDTNVIEMSKKYGTIPLMLTSTLTPQGITNIESAYILLMNEDYQNHHIDSIITILKEKGFYGVNMSLSYINSSNIDLYNKFVTKAADRIKKEGFLYMVTINPSTEFTEGRQVFEKLDYSTISQVSDSISFTHFYWGINPDPPGPVSSYTNFREFLDYLVNLVSPDKIRIGMPVLGYDWALPYIAGSSTANAISLISALNLANESNSIINFDEVSQTPYFEYNQQELSTSIEHIVWFIDARSVNSILSLISEYRLSGKGFWSIMKYYPQMWLVINSQFNIVKLIPDQI